MAELTWTGSGVFSDPARNFTARPDTTHDFDEDRAEEYLGHQSDNWNRPEDEDSTDPGTESSGERENEGNEDDASDASEIDGSEEADSGSKSNDDFTDLDKVGDAKAEGLRDAGYASFADLDDASVDELSDVDGVSQSLAENIDEQINEDHA